MISQHDASAFLNTVLLKKGKSVNWLSQTMTFCLLKVWLISECGNGMLNCPGYSGSVKIAQQKSTLAEGLKILLPFEDSGRPLSIPIPFSRPLFYVFDFEFYLNDSNLALTFSKLLIIWGLKNFCLWLYLSKHLLLVLLKKFIKDSFRFHGNSFRERMGHISSVNGIYFDCTNIHFDCILKNSN